VSPVPNVDGSNIRTAQAMWEVLGTVRFWGRFWGQEVLGTPYLTLQPTYLYYLSSDWVAPGTQFLCQAKLIPRASHSSVTSV
jgi:hypothetical protein